MTLTVLLFAISEFDHLEILAFTSFLLLRLSVVFQYGNLSIDDALKS